MREFKKELNNVEIEGLIAMFSKFYSEYIGEEQVVNFGFFMSGGYLNSEDDANGYPLEFEGIKISHLTMTEGGLTYLVGYDEDDNEVTYEFNCYNDEYIKLGKDWTEGFGEFIEELGK